MTVTAWVVSSIMAVAAGWGVRGLLEGRRAWNMWLGEGHTTATPRRIATEVIERRGGVERATKDALRDGGLVPLLEEVAQSAIERARPDLRVEALRQARAIAKKHHSKAVSQLNKEIPDPRVHAKLSGHAEAAGEIERRLHDLLRYYGRMEDRL